MLEQIVGGVMGGFIEESRDALKEKIDFVNLIDKAIKKVAHERINDVNRWENLAESFFQNINIKYLKPLSKRFEEAREKIGIYDSLEKKLALIDKLSFNGGIEKNHSKDQYSYNVERFLRDEDGSLDSIKQLLNKDRLEFNGSTEFIVSKLKDLIINKENRFSTYFKAFRNKDGKKTLSSKKIYYNFFQVMKRKKIRAAFERVYENEFAPERAYKDEVAKELNYAFRKMINTFGHKGYIDLDESARALFTEKSIEFFRKTLVQGVGEVYYAMKIGGLHLYNMMNYKMNMPIVGRFWKSKLKGILGKESLPEFKDFVKYICSSKLKFYGEINRKLRHLPEIKEEHSNQTRKFNTLSFYDQKVAYKKRMQFLHDRSSTIFDYSRKDAFYVRIELHNEFKERLDCNLSYGRNSYPDIPDRFSKYIFSASTAAGRLKRREELLIDARGFSGIVGKVGAYGLLIKDSFNFHFNREKFRSQMPEEKVSHVNQINESNILMGRSIALNRNPAEIEKVLN